MTGIETLAADDATIEALAGLLVATVAAGGSVSFMHPLDPERARGFWRDSFARAASGRIILGAWADGVLAGTITLDPCPMPNQPHRADIAKLMVAPGFRGRGIARALVLAAEAAARRLGRWLLTLDTAEEDGAAGLYQGLGYIPCGRIPDFALKPHGGLTATLLFYKRLE
ncbi:GNAT family N-acetyltransferase [Zavarzinia compransoris]|uniref:GNAT family N-acetyltransferase n=1 Tax=Zavarzinia marina TaxID=2911065 RepID=UPI001F3569F6|nr:GNAT family N-acetyltransferase [Zavarzinia marina]MCF4166880.1 GNAT family N-acetyltransferase [Zavarzinia marina]